MASGIESALVKPVVDALVALYKKARTSRLKSTAEKALAQAIRELLLAPSDLKSAEAKIAIAKAAGLINDDLLLAEDMVVKHKAGAKRGPVLKTAPVKKAPAKKVAAKVPAKPAAKKAAAKKAAAKKAPAKKV
ncbi:MAG TPA: hypothetical protein VGE47_15730 [Burkholderiaceae bacterium]